MSLTSPERRAEMVVEWKAQRLMLLKYRNRISDDIRDLEDMIGSFEKTAFRNVNDSPADCQGQSGGPRNG